MWRWLVLPLALVSAVASAQFGVVETHDIVYTQGGGAPQTLDLYHPVVAAGDLRPAIVFVHGGGWSGGSKEDFAGWGQYYGAQGYVCISINYRLSPQYAWPAQIDDTQAAVRWLRKNAGAIGLDPNRIGAVGASAGGHLVLLLGQTDTMHDVEPGLKGFSSRVQAVCDYYGPTDLTIQAEWDPIVWQLISWLAGGGAPNRNPNYGRASPIRYVTSDDAPTLIFHGDVDNIVPVQQSRKLYQAMLAKGVPVIYHEFAGEGHGFGNAFWTSVFALTDFFNAKLGT